MTGMAPSVLEVLVENIAKHPAKPALIYRGEEFTYEGVWNRILLASQWLHEHGVREGSRVILCLPNGPEFMFYYFGVHLLRAIAVVVSPESTEETLRWIHADSKATLLLTKSRGLQGPTSAFQVEQIVSQNRFEGSIPKLRTEQTADILYTTGTTGTRKGVVLTHGNILSAARNINSFIGNGATDVEVLPMPLSHSFGLGRLRCTMVMGSTLILEDNLMYPPRVLNDVMEYQATGFCSVPAGFALILRTTGEMLGRAKDHLRYIEIGSAPMPVDQKRTLMRLLPKTRICMHYGLTEASRSTFLEFHSAPDALDSIGLPSPNVQIRILTDAGTDAAVNEAGEILVKGSHIMKEYWRNPELNQTVMVDGWLRTDDVGMRSKNGYLYLLGRKHEIINVGGKKVAPYEVETALNRFPGITESACIGIPDPDGITGEKIMAFLVTNGSPVRFDEVALFLRQQLEPHMMPTVYEILQSLPKTSSGKIQKKSLRTNPETGNA